MEAWTACTSPKRTCHSVNIAACISNSRKPNPALPAESRPEKASALQSETPKQSSTKESAQSKSMRVDATYCVRADRPAVFLEEVAGDLTKSELKITNESDQNGALKNHRMRMINVSHSASLRV